MFNVPERTPRSRRAGVAPQRDCKTNLKKLYLGLRGFAPDLRAVRDMANELLTERDVRHVQYMARKLCQANRPRDPTKQTIGREVLWFKRTKATYGLCDEDTYNFDEASFTIGKSRLNSHSPPIYHNPSKRRT